MKKDFEEIIYYGSLAASTHNTQPWKFRIQKDGILIFPDYSRALPVVDPDHHALFISLGCAVENMVIAAEHLGYEPLVHINTGEEPYIRLALHAYWGRKDNPLFQQIKIRQSTRNRYSGEPIPAGHLEMLRAAAIEENVEFRIITGNETEPVIDLVREACIRQYSNKPFVEELVHWIRFNRSKAAKSHDGLYSAATGNPAVPDWLGRWLLDFTVSPAREAKKCESLIRSSSALVVFIGERDDVTSWIHAGRSFERFSLTATGLGINNAHENMPCEDFAVRRKFGGLLHLDDEKQPLLLLRIGYSEKMPYSYRRPVEELMIEGADTPVEVAESIF